MLKGPEAYRAIDEALKDIRREEDDITRRIARASERVAKLRETELALVRELAQLRLDPEAGIEVQGALSQAERRARDMLAAHALEMSAREDRLDAIEATLAGLSAERGETLTRLEDLRARFAGYEEKARAALAADGAQAAPLARRAELDAMIGKAQDKAALARADADAKSKPYDADPLFSYLYARGYGTGQYRAMPLIRYLDGKVARLVRFTDARANYVALKAIPQRLEEHVTRLEEERDALDTALDAALGRAIAAAGGADVGRAIDEAEAALTRIDAAIVDAEDARDAITEEHKALAEGRDPSFDDAVGVLATALARTDSAALLAQARQTGTPEDDAIVVKIEDARLRASEDEAEIRDQRSRLATLETRRRELEDISYEFKTERFDDPRSTFGEDKLVGDLLNDFLRGAITASAYWGHWRNSQNWTGGSGPIVPPAQQRGSTRAGGGFTLPPGGFSPRPSGGGWGGGWGSGGKPSGGNRSAGSKPAGGGFSRPRTGSRGSRKSGGFKTGGGF